MNNLLLSLHPALPVLIAIALCPFLGVMGQRVVSVAAPLLSLVWTLMLPLDGSAGWSVEVMGLTLSVWEWDAMGRLFMLAFGIFGSVAAIYAWTEAGAGRKVAALFNIAGGMGVVLAGDLYSLFFFWEMLTISSMVIIFLGQDRDSFGAGLRYAYFHLLGGVSLLGGAILAGGSYATVLAMGTDSLAFWLILFGVLVNAAVPPLHAWLPDAYPRASIYGTVVLAAFTTKATVCIAARLFPGEEPLVWLGVAMALFGVSYAVLENNMRRLLSYHIVSQVGYMITAIGLGNMNPTGDYSEEKLAKLTHAGELAVNGAVAHAINNIFYKGLLLMSVGAVIYATGYGRLTKLGGLGKAMLWTMILCIIGGVSISGLPFFNGFVSKGMIISSTYYMTTSPWDSRAWVELLLVVAAMGTFFSVGLKLPYLAFIAAPKSGIVPEVKRPVPRSMIVAMSIAAFFCIAIGVYPQMLYHYLPYQPESGPLYKVFTLDHFVGTFQLLLGTLAAFWFVRELVRTKPTFTLDVDQLYRRPLDRLFNGIGVVAQSCGVLSEDLVHGGRHLLWDRLQSYRQMTVRQPLAQHVAIVITVLTIAAIAAIMLYG